MKALDALYCRRLIRANSSTFYQAFRRLPKPKADAVFAVYAFCRLTDDAAERDAGELKSIRQELDAFCAGRVPPKPQWRQLALAFERYKLSPEPFRLMMEGQEADVSAPCFKTQEELIHYCYLVASSVGLMLLPILADSITPEITQAAVDLGIAMQLTNILRDIGEDCRNGRVYLPRDMMIAYGCTEEDLRKGVVSESFTKLWEALARMAEDHYGKAAAGIPLYSPDSRELIRLAAAYYQGILEAVRRNGYDVFGSRAIVSDRDKRALRTALQKGRK